MNDIPAHRQAVPLRSGEPVEIEAGAAAMPAKPAFRDERRPAAAPATETED